MNDSLSELYSIFEWSADAVLIVRNLRIVFVNQTMRSLSKDISVGTNINRIFDSDVIQNILSVFSKGVVSLSDVKVLDSVCSLCATPNKDAVIVTLFNVSNKGFLNGKEEAIAWLRAECDELRAQIASASSALSLIANSVSPYIYKRIADYLAAINHGHFKAQKLLGNILYVINQYSKDASRKTVCFSSQLSSMVKGFSDYFAPDNIKIHLLSLPEGIYTTCDISSVRRAIYNIFDCMLDFLAGEGEILLDVSTCEKLINIKIICKSPACCKDVFADLFNPKGSSRARFVEDVAKNHGGEFSSDPKMLSVSFSILRTAVTPELLRSLAPDYEVGEFELLCELSSSLPVEKYYLKRKRRKK